MLRINDSVLYGTDGVCTITAIIDKTIAGKSQKYYVLNPVNQKGYTIFAPVENKNTKQKLRRLLSQEEVMDLIEVMPDEGTIWIENDNQRRETYKEIISGGDRVQLVKLIKTLYLNQQERKDSGKKMRASDEKLMREAEQVLYDELAHVLEIDHEQVLPFISQQIKSLQQ